MIQTTLHHTAQYKWQKISKGWWCSKGFIDNNKQDVNQLENHLNSCKSKDDLLNFLEKINGFFALIWTIDDSTYVAVDHARSFPLFWRSNGGKVIISDHLTKDKGDSSRWLKEKALSHGVFVPGHATLLQGWNQLQAGECMEINSTGICYLHTWFDHHRRVDLSKTQSLWERNFRELIERQTKRLIKWAAGRTIVIPLSGGYDSRYILAALVKEGYKNLKAFTYGLADSSEVQLAKKVAIELSIEWIFVPYTVEILDLFFTEQWERYVDFSCNMTTLPQDQDFFALAHLKKIDWLQTGDIICPGYTGDFQAGSYHPGSYFKFPWRKSKALSKYVYHKFVKDDHTEIKQLWASHLPDSEKRTEHEIISELEDWVLREYVSKYIINGIRAYEFFSYDWYLPLWDQEFIRFWQEVPNELRNNMQLYRSTLEGFLFSPLGIYFKEDEHQFQTDKQYSNGLLSSKWKGKIKSIVPGIKSKQVTTEHLGISYLTSKIYFNLKNELADTELDHNQVVGLWLDGYLKDLE